MVKGQFFHHFPDGSGGAYCTMMGSDQRITKVVTPAKTNRKIAIIKDSFGNAIPGYLFSSFREVHVLDYRYFPRNLRQYIKDNGITDLAICVNIFSAYSQGISERISKMLDQPNHIVAPAKNPSQARARPANPPTPKSPAARRLHPNPPGSPAPPSNPPPPSLKSPISQ